MNGAQQALFTCIIIFLYFPILPDWINAMSCLRFVSSILG